jgi:hypothetical protein
MSKLQIVVIVEGQTEVNALTRSIGQHLYNLTGCSAVFAVIGKTRDVKGGYRSLEVFISQIKMFARQYPGVYISTFFDYYGFNPKWKDFVKLKESTFDIKSKVARMEELMASKVLESVGESLWAGHFLPYI